MAFKSNKQTVIEIRSLRAFMKARSQIQIAELEKQKPHSDKKIFALLPVKKTNKKIMSGVLRRGSLNFDLDNRSKRGSIETNLYGGYCDTKTVKTPEISVISFDFRRHSADLKKDRVTVEVNAKRQQPISPTKNPSDDPDSDIISDLIGHYGKWNFIWTFILSLFQIMPTFQMFAFVFQTADKDFWCARPQHLANVNETIWKNLTQTSDSCAIRDIDYAAMNSTESLLDSLLTPQTTWNFTQCEHFEFETNNNDQSMTLVQEFGLVCSNRQLLSVVEMCFLAGAAVGSVSSGWISDKFGRKHTLMAFALLQATFGTILAFSTSLGMYMTLRVIIGYASMTVTVVSFVLVVELVSGKWRVIVGILNILPVAVTYVITAGISYFIRDWRTLQLTITLPWFVILSIWYCVPESPRWLLAKGRLDELYGIVERAARLNGITLPANYRKALEAVVPPSSHNKTKTSINGTNCEEATSSVNNENVNKTEVDANASPLVVVFSKAYLRTTCLTLIVWLTLIIIYFGLTLHLSNLGGNIYVNTAIAGSVEAVSICLSVFVVLKLGIRVNLIAYMLIPGVCCLAVNIIPKGDENLIYVIALAMIAKCVIGANNAIIPTYTAMQYPTIVRNFGVGMGNLAAGVGLILVPYMWLLEHIDPLLPMSVMGVSGLIGAIALALMKDVRP